MMQLLYCAKYAWYRGTEVLFNTRYHANSLEHIVPHMKTVREDRFGGGGGGGGTFIGTTVLVLN